MVLCTFLTTGTWLTKFGSYLIACEYLPSYESLSPRSLLIGTFQNLPCGEDGGGGGGERWTSQKEQPEFDFVFKPPDIGGRGNVG